jgi:hypothetical protein
VQALVKMIVKLWFYKMLGISWLIEGLLTSQEGLQSMDSWSQSVGHAVM